MQIDPAKIAVCLITGNEEDIIQRALDSAFRLTDTVIVVRACGGNAPDRSLDIAKARGCIVGEYHNHPATAAWPFVDDFAAARNLAFRLAEQQTNAGWLMWMDCDDELEPGMSERMRQAVSECEEDWILCDYWLPQHGKSVMRERLFRRGTAAWFNAVHEKCVPVSRDSEKESLRVRVRRDLRIVHSPLQSKSGSQERNLNILLWRYQEAQHIAFYLHYENYLLSRREDAVKYGLQALRFDNLEGVYRYEILMNLGLLAEENAHGQEMMKRAIKLCPQRREAHHLLSLLQMDAGQHAEALATAQHVLTLPPPRVPEWTHRPDCYGWKAQAALAWAHRLAGEESRAVEIETALLESGERPRISLLHATRGRWAQAIGAMNLWLTRAENPAAIEHWFAVDEDDAEGREKLARFRHVIVPAGGYSVGAWNAAAAASTGDILIQMADDFEPPPGWDRAIIAALGEQLSSSRVLRVSDGLRQDGLITCAIVTRAWFDKHGLFDPAFRNVYSDNDLTTRAAKESAIIEARDIVIRHHHPMSGKVAWDDTYQRGNDPLEYERARKIYEGKHP